VVHTNSREEIAPLARGNSPPRRTTKPPVMTPPWPTVEGYYWIDILAVRMEHQLHEDARSRDDYEAWMTTSATCYQWNEGGQVPVLRRIRAYMEAAYIHTKHEATAYNFNSGRPVRGRHAAAEDPDPEAPATCRRLVATAADDSVDEAKPQPSPLERGRQCQAPQMDVLENKAKLVRPKMTRRPWHRRMALDPEPMSQPEQNDLASKLRTLGDNGNLLEKTPRDQDLTVYGQRRQPHEHLGHRPPSE
jgi:hypothetical protein